MSKSNKKNKKNEKANEKANEKETSSSLIPADLYSEQPKFVDKKTLLEYFDSVQQANAHIFKGETFFVLSFNIILIFLI